MNAKEVSAGKAGSVSLGGEVSVHWLGFGAMRLTGDGIGGPPKNHTDAITVLNDEEFQRLSRVPQLAATR